MNKPKIIICQPGNSFSNIWLEARDQMIMKMLQAGYQVMNVYGYDPNLFNVRNLCAGQVLMNQNRIDYDYMLWLDSDVLAPFEVFERLLAHDKDIIAAPYLMKNQKISTVVKGLMWDTDYVFEYFTKAELEKNAGLQQVKYVGFGFTLIKKGVFEKMHQYPWFKQITINNNGKTIILGDDHSWCHYAEDKGFKIYADLSTRVGHLKGFVV